MPRVRRTDNSVIPLTRHQEGYIAPRQTKSGLVSYVFFSTQKRSLGVPYPPPNKREAVMAGNEIVSEWKDRASRGSLTNTPRTVRQAWKLFWDARIAMKHGKIRSNAKEALAMWLPNDTYLETNHLFQVLLKRYEEIKPLYREGTIRNRVFTIRRFFAFTVSFGWLSSNPMSADRFALEVTRKGDVETFTDEEVAMLFADVQKRILEAEPPKRESLKEFLLLLRLLDATGMRIGEALALRWDENIFDDRIFINNTIKSHKDIPKGTKNKKNREIPLTIDLLFADLRIVLQELRKINGTKEKVFSWSNRASIRLLMQTSMQNCGLYDTFHSFHRFRSHARHRWERLGISSKVLCEWLGHNQSVYERSYLLPLTAKQSAELVNNHLRHNAPSLTSSE